MESRRLPQPRGASVFEAATATAADPTPLLDDGPGRLAPGDAFGNYRVTRLLGRGGMGEVYEAVDVLRDAHVALKTSRRRLDEDERLRFQHEGKVAASISHPNVVYVLDARRLTAFPSSSPSW